MTQHHHYYATCAYGWAVADTRDKAVKKLADEVGSATIKRLKTSNGGMAAIVCRVDLPEAAHYTISAHMPSIIQKEDGVNETRKGEAVPVSEVEGIRITSVKGATVPREI